MENAFELLGLPERPDLTDEELRTAFRGIGGGAHPDAGGDTRHFEKLQEAHSLLSSPARRLRHWLELRGFPVDPRGAIDPGLMDLFGRVGDAVAKAENLVRRRTAARSALGMALLEEETRRSCEELERLIASVGEEIRIRTERFPQLRGEGGPFEGDPAALVRDLLFLERWRSSLRKLPPLLV